MAPAVLEQEDHSRDAAFKEAMHKDSAASKGGFSAMMGKNKEAHKASLDEYFKHWDNKAAKDETLADREVRFPPFMKYVNELTPLTGPKSRICYPHQAVGLLCLCTIPVFQTNFCLVTTILPRISTSMAGDNLSISADSHMVKVSTKQLPGTNIISLPKL